MIRSGLSAAELPCLHGPEGVGRAYHQSVRFSRYGFTGAGDPLFSHNHTAICRRLVLSCQQSQSSRLAAGQGRNC